MKCHGEFKPAGGKLVVADFSVAGGYLVDVQISGDFFLFPDEAIHWINNSLNGASVTSDAASLAQRVRLMVGPDVEMLGFSPEAIAEAVRRGCS